MQHGRNKPQEDAMLSARESRAGSALGAGRARCPIQTVYGQTQSFDDDLTDAAPLRSPAYADAADRRAAQASADPWDPWPPQRVGYGAPAPASLFLPSRSALDGLTMHLNRLLR